MNKYCKYILLNIFSELKYILKLVKTSTITSTLLSNNIQCNLLVSHMLFHSMFIPVQKKWDLTLNLNTEERLVQVDSKCRNFPSFRHPPGKQFFGITGHTLSITLRWYRVSLEGQSQHCCSQALGNVCSWLEACAGLSSRETAQIRAEQERRCDSLQGAEISKMRNATFGNAIVLKMKLQTGFFKSIVCSVWPI